MYRGYLEFLRSFHTEKIRTMEQRSRYVQLKIGFIIGILGLGSLGTQDLLVTPDMPGLNSSLILLITPVVAIGYDYYINGSDHSIKRMGAFIRLHPGLFSTCEGEWEKFVVPKRGTYGPRANLIFSLTATIVAGALLAVPAWFNEDLRLYLLPLGIWFVIAVSSILYLFTEHRKLVEDYDGLQNPGRTEEEKEGDKSSGEDAGERGE